jgi:beta-glucosidase
LTYSRKPSGFSQNGGLIAYQDDDNYIKLVYGAAGGRGFGRSVGNQSGSILLVTEENGSTKNIATISMTNIIKDDCTLFLKLEKIGDEYIASYSIDGKKFEPLGSAKILLKDIRTGILICEGVLDPRMARFMQGQSQHQSAAQNPFEVSVDYFHIKNSGAK